MEIIDRIDEFFANRANPINKTFDIDGEKIKVRAITKSANLMGWKVFFKDGTEIKIFNVLKAEEAAKRALDKKKAKQGEK